VKGAGVLHCAQDGGKNKQQQEARTDDSKRQKQIPFGDDNQEKQRQTAKYRGLSTTQGTVRLFPASVEMTFYKLEIASRAR
jgi:hypothetical protein